MEWTPESALKVNAITEQEYKWLNNNTAEIRHDAFIFVYGGPTSITEVYTNKLYPDRAEKILINNMLGIPNGKEI